MIIKMPEPISNYFSADAEDGGGAVSKCFTEDAVVKDEGKTHVGRDAIRQWKSMTGAKFSYTVEPTAIAVEDGRTVVTGHLEGDFPGSPVDLRYFFELDGDLIAGLEIKP